MALADIARTTLAKGEVNGAQRQMEEVLRILVALHGSETHPEVEAVKAELKKIKARKGRLPAVSKLLRYCAPRKRSSPRSSSGPQGSSSEPASRDGGSVGSEENDEAIEMA